MVFVSGRVKSGSIILPQGSSLNQALAAGGPKIVRGKVEFIRFKKVNSKKEYLIILQISLLQVQNPILMNGDLIRVQDNIWTATSSVLGELTSPFIGVYSILNFFNGVF